MRALGLAIILPALVAVATACGSEAGGSGAAVVETITADTGTEPAPAGSIRALLAERPGADVALVLGSSDFVPGANRISFLVVNQQSELIIAPSATVR